jgi:hypothetical protein
LCTNNLALFHSSRKACRYSRIEEEPVAKLRELYVQLTLSQHLVPDLGCLCSVAACASAGRNRHKTTPTPSSASVCEFVRI